jgi:hypothetical protein
MTTTAFPLTSKSRLYSRNEIITILQSAVTVDANRFGRKVAEHWLKSYPGDLHVGLLYAKTLLHDNREELAVPILERICQVDPESLPAQQLLSSFPKNAPQELVVTAKACVVVLSGEEHTTNDIPMWGNMLVQAKEEEKQGNKTISESLIHKALLEEPATPLIAALHLKSSIKELEWIDLRDLAQTYLAQWPNCLLFNLILADTLIKGGQEERAVILLHHAVNLDVAGQVPNRFWGQNHAFRSLWPNSLSTVLPFPIPADIARVMGWNQLPSGAYLHNSNPSLEKATHTSENDTQKFQSSKTTAGDQPFSSVRSEFERIAKKIKFPEIAKADGRFPAFIVMTTRVGLESQYGSKNLAKIQKALLQVVESTQVLANWNAYLVFADDPENTDKYGIPPAKAKDPWSIKNLINDLDKALFSRGEMIGALLIVGGHKVVPFHRLPNPVDDFDNDVPSDNPYACNDENYFIQNWPVGRLPGSSSDNTEELIKQLNSIVEHRQQGNIHKSILEKIISFLRNLLPNKHSRPSFGYSAEIWRRAANSVFRPIGKPHTLVISPPTEAEHISKQNGKLINMAYYNLHGLENSSNWYGQRDPIETFDGPDYPIAFRPRDIVNNGRAPKIIFSESCFGANSIDKTTDEAICLKFLASGTQALVGSTCTSYGAIATPLIAADLLGKAFWRFLLDGFTAGEALRRAKIHLVKEMHKRQGFLDGEDQKTLISFVLYGDPLAQAEKHNYQTKNTFRTSIDTAQVKTICDKANQDQPPNIPADVVHQVKNIVRNYLPGMSGAKVLYSQDHSECKGHHCPSPKLETRSTDQHDHSRRVVTLSKQIVHNSNTHQHHARITMNNEGKIIKLAISK